MVKLQSTLGLFEKQAPMHLPGSLQLLALIIAGGKAAIGGAGLTLALIGMMNVVISTIGSGWAQIWLHSGIETLTVPYLAIAGGVLGAAIGLRARRSA